MDEIECETKRSSILYPPSSVPKNMALEFSPETYKKFEETVNRYPKKEAAMLPVLCLAQKEFGHLGQEAIEYVAQLMGQSPARVCGVVSFYTMLNTKPIGWHHIQVCRTLPCALRGAEKLTGFIRKRWGSKSGRRRRTGDSRCLKSSAWLPAARRR